MLRWVGGSIPFGVAAGLAALVGLTGLRDLLSAAGPALFIWSLRAFWERRYRAYKCPICGSQSLLDAPPGEAAPFTTA